MVAGAFRFVWLRSLLAVAASAVLASGAAAAARPESPSTLAVFSGVARSFDADAGRVAWIDSAWVLHVRSARSGVETTIHYTNPYQEIPSLATGPPLVLEPRQLLWLSTRGVAGFEDADHTYVATVGATRGRRLTNLVHSEGGAGGYVTGLAGDGSAFAYGTVTVNEIQTNGSVYQVSGGGVWTLTGSMLRRLTGAPPAIVLAESAGRVAIAPVDTGERQDGTPAGAGTVEVRNAATGALVSSVMPTGPIRAAALTPTILAVLAGTQIERYDVASGKLLGSTRVAADTASQLDAAGELIAFRRSRSVGVLDARSGRISKMVVTSWAPTGVALDGRTLAWAERRRVAPGAVSKKTFNTQIRTLTLPS